MIDCERRAFDLRKIVQTPGTMQLNCRSTKDTTVVFGENAFTSCRSPMIASFSTFELDDIAKMLSFCGSPSLPISSTGNRLENVLIGDLVAISYLKRVPSLTAVFTKNSGVLCSILFAEDVQPAT